MVARIDTEAPEWACGVFNVPRIDHQDGARTMSPCSRAGDALTGIRVAVVRFHLGLFGDADNREGIGAQFFTPVALNHRGDTREPILNGMSI